MVDPTPSTPAAPAPATASAVSPAVAQRFVEPDMMMRLKIDGKDYVVPAAEAVKDIQLSKASYARMAKADQMMAEAKALEEPAKRYRDLMDLKARNPQQFVEEMERLAGVPRDATLTHEQTTTPQQAPNTRDALSERIAALEARQYQTSIEAEIQQTLDSYPLFRTNAKAREAARTQIAAQMLVDQRAQQTTSVSDVAKDFHTFLFDSGVKEATAERDARQARQGSLPSIPSNIGPADLAAMPNVTAEDFKKPGAIMAKLRQTMQRFGGQAAGNV